MFGGPRRIRTSVPGLLSCVHRASYFFPEPSGENLSFLTSLSLTLSLDSGFPVPELLQTENEIDYRLSNL